ncbi:hypothetical protein E4191_01885 [Paracoccus liaowanqingii]|uniref:Uncharacterized protein n=1 Tax=Paracoccus liaowanqingii TaxID=2560053 RepID=A0A4P7HHU2_9RHOB|nr:hypothetical protein [Paracoccus liaowanqingii]QBX33606.1 hypothetical protein E4191_01885 [Paracoccus liaowanqingii]
MSLIARISSLSQRDRITTVGLTLTGIWLLLLFLFWLLVPASDGGRGGIAPLITTAGIILPPALVWLGVSLARQLAILRAEAEDLRRRLGQMHDAPPPASDRAPERVPDTPEPRSAAPRGAPATATVAPPARPAMAAALSTTAGAAQPRGRAAPDARTSDARQADQRQAAMRFDTQGGTPVDPGTLIRALNFPDGPADHEAIEALRHALKDPVHSRVLRAAQDVVTLLAGQDVYMDDLPPEPARADVWRRFAEGDRGSAVAALGGIHQRPALETAEAMLQGDEIFRDTAHHFLRHFDGMVATLVPQLDDLQIAVLADSRSARAFMLLGRVSGNFG